jgi:hypothetical protein
MNMIENHMNFDQLCKLLKKNNPISVRPGVPLTYVQDSLPEFVAPTLRQRTDVEQPAQPRILVVSAPGAVGKTTLARQLAHQAGIPFWDLARYGTVGQGSVAGAFAASFGFPQMGAVHSALANGQIAIAVDALDEARVKVNEAAFEDFLRDIAQTSTLSKGVSFVLFGRNQIAETAWLVLSEAGIDVAFYAIEAFTRSDAERYIERRVERSSADAAQRMLTHSGPFREARALILDGLGQAISGSQPTEATTQEARDFVGYAPVLDAVSVLLAGEGNWNQLRSRIRSEVDGISQTRNRAATLLRVVVDGILQREHQAKLVANIKPALQSVASQANWSQWETLYMPEEQCARLVAKLLDISYQPSLSLPGALAVQYEQQISSWLPADASPDVAASKPRQNG